MSRYSLLVTRVSLLEFNCVFLKYMFHCVRVRYLRSGVATVRYCTSPLRPGGECCDCRYVTLVKSSLSCASRTTFNRVRTSSTVPRTVMFATLSCVAARCVVEGRRRVPYSTSRQRVGWGYEYSYEQEGGTSGTSTRRRRQRPSSQPQLSACATLYCQLARQIPTRAKTGRPESFGLEGVSFTPFRGASAVSNFP